MIFRRTALLAAAAATLAPSAVHARGRMSLGGRVAFSMPWPLGAIDPHRIDDVGAAVLGDALFDTLYAKDEANAVTASLAETDPLADDGGLKVTLRSGLKTAYGRPIEARDVAASITRARSLGGRAWLAEIPFPKVEGKTTLIFPTKDGARLARTLSSPFAAIVPISFNADRPDGTGPFRFERRADGVALVRNGNAARGPSFLDEILVRGASDLATSLRRFESGTDDMGWLGSGLHEPRRGAVAFDAGAVAWAVLRTGRDAGSWDAPGVAQTIADGIPHGRLSYLALGPAWPTATVATWGGAPADLIVRDDCPWLVELAKAVAGTLTTPSHEVTAKPVSAGELAQRRASRGFALAIDVARPVAPGAAGAYVGLATADNPQTAASLSRHPPGNASPRLATRLMRLGVLGEIRVQGGRVADLVLPPCGSAPGIDWGAATKGRR